MPYSTSKGKHKLHRRFQKLCCSQVIPADQLVREQAGGTGGKLSWERKSEWIRTFVVYPGAGGMFCSPCGLPRGFRAEVLIVSFHYPQGELPWDVNSADFMFHIAKPRIHLIEAK